MLIALLRALRHYRWLKLLAAALFLSSLGSGLTLVLTMGLLLEWQAPALTLVLAYTLSTLPGWFGSLIGEKLCQRLSPFQILILAETIGLFSLGFLGWGVLHQQSRALLLAQSVAALSGGMSFPALSQLLKSYLREEELPAATALETLVFAANVVVGIGVGVLIFGHLPPLALLALDALSFILAIVLIAMAGKKPSQQQRPEQDQDNTVSTIMWRKLSPLQQRSMLMLPMLASVGTPAMALMPALARSLPAETATGVALPLLLARGLGQLCGPLLLPADNLKNYASSNKLLLGCLIIFLGCYWLLPFSPVALLALGLIFIAHLASNVVYALVTFGLLANFSRQHISSASARAWRWQILTVGAISILAGGLADYLGPILAMELMSGISLIVSGGLLYFTRVKKSYT